MRGALITPSVTSDDEAVTMGYWRCALWFGSRAIRDFEEVKEKSKENLDRPKAG